MKEIPKHKIEQIDAKIQARKMIGLSSEAHKQNHQHKDSTIEKRLLLLEQKIKEFDFGMEKTMQYIAEIGRLKAQYAQEGYPSNSTKIIQSIFSKAKLESESNSKNKKRE
jgi:ferritin-like protein